MNGVNRIKKKSILGYIKKVKKRISNPENWTKGCLSKNKDGQEVDSFHESAVSFCIVGALRKEMKVNYFKNFSKYEDCLQFLNECTGGVAEYNDRETIKHHHVMKKLDSIINNLEKELCEK